MLASSLGYLAGKDGLNPEPGPGGLEVVLAGGDASSANHKLLLLLLHKWGHHVTAEPDAGAGAGDAPADLVLLDLDACGVGGLPRPAGVTARRVGMVADRETWLRHCGAVPGVDELLAKPVNPQALRAVVQAASAARARRPDFAVPDAMGASAFDYSLALTKADAWIVEVIGEDFIKSWPEQLAALRDACARGEVLATQRTAHTLRGLAANFNAEPVCNLARAFEQAGVSGTQGQFGPWLGELGSELSALNAALLAFCQAGARH